MTARCSSTNTKRNSAAAGSPGSCKYQAQAADPTLTGAQLSPHVLRHSRAMHLYDAGVPLPYIRDILGHVDLSTTEIYARASTEAKRKALEAVYDQVVSAD